MFSRVLVASALFHRCAVRLVCWVMAGVLGASLLQAAAGPASAAPAVKERPETVNNTSVVAQRPPKEVKPRTPNAALAASTTDPEPVSWPAPGAAEFAVSAPATGRAALATPTTKVGGLAVSVTAPSTPAVTDGRAAGQATVPDRVRLAVLDRKASETTRATGPMFRVGRSDGQQASGRVQVTVGYEGIAGLFGGDYGARLRLARLPECALTTPELAECVGQSVPTLNNSADRTLSAELTATANTGVLYTMLADDSSSQGNYGATKLSASAKWSVGPSTGGFSWSYPLRTPPVPAGAGPGITLSYSSQAVDGRTATTNNQGSWLGEGFSYEPGYIERRYKPCVEDGHSLSGDMCWAYDNATVMLNGSATDLIMDGSTWRLASDDGSKIERLTGATNGDDDGEYWLITTVDGTQHYFGRNRLPGWSANKEETASTWTMPVFGDDTNEPCKKPTFAESYCDQAWRWSLDYVKDRYGNVTSYFYERESNYYARGARFDRVGVEYHRAGWLKRIDYGQRDGQVYSTNAPARVHFDTKERCLPTGNVDCDPQDLTSATARYWPDVPWDRNCARDTRCTVDQIGPSFWSRKRLTSIRTEIRGASGWSPVDQWKLDHLLTDNGDGSRTLWLYKITHTGLVGGSESMPAVELGGLQLPNRIDRPDDFVSPLIRFRLATVYTESAGQIDVNYMDADCVVGSLPTEGRSTRRCFPVKWKPLGSGTKVTDWFHKYVVRQIVETDRTQNSPDAVTRYNYLDGAAWRHADKDGIADPDDLTWSEWRGYGKVQVSVGDGIDNMTTRTEHRYLRGMFGDKNPDGGTRPTTVTDSAGTVHTDYDEYAGHEYESIAFNGSTQLSKTLSIPWRHNTATESHDDDDRIVKRAYIVKTASVRDLTALGTERWRETKSTSTFETRFGRVTQVNDEGEVGKAGDEKCTITTYADSSTAYLYSLVARVESVSVGCAATPDRKTQVISDSRTWYDGEAFGVAPTRGNPTRTEELASHDGTTARYLKVAETTFDDYGRPRTVTDAEGGVTETDYTETDGLTTKVVQTSPLGHDTTMQYAPAWGSPVSQVDPNGLLTLSEHDPLGRLVKVWLPDNVGALNLPPSIRYTYLIDADKAAAVKTETRLSGLNYRVEYQGFDAWLRPRQVQTPGPDGTRLVADTFYDSTGQVNKTYDTYQAAGSPNADILPVVNGDVDGQTLNVYDGAGRIREAIFAVAGVEKWRTTTTYGGDWVSVDPPAGGTPRTTFTNALGQAVESWQYKGDAPAGDADRTKYTYTPPGQLATVEDPAGNLWRYQYDQRGRKVEMVDPDAGTSTFTYDDLDQLISTSNGVDATIYHTYDAAGRKTATYEGPDETGELLSQWVYDQELLGALSVATRFVDGAAYNTLYSNYDEFYRAKTTEYEVPTEAGAELAGIYDFGVAYNRDGTVQATGMPDGGGLPYESIAYTYDSLQRLISTTSDDPYLTYVDYSATGEVLQSEVLFGTKKIWSTYEFEQGTKRLSRQRLDRSEVPIVDTDARYDYDPAGNIKRIADTPSGTRDVQCFSYDYLRRMEGAWTSDSTATDPCAGGPAATGVGGIAAYHHSYSYDLVGNRKTETHHAVASAAAKTRTYEYPQPGQPQPHTLTRMTETDPSGSRLHAYDYDDAGNTTRRTGPGKDQTLVWDAEGNLASVAEAGKTTSFVYDVDGSRLLRKEPGATTLYLPGMELRLDHSTRVVDGTRYYSIPGGGTIVRRINGLSYVAPDHNGTGRASVDAAGGVLHRRLTPFGEARGTQPAPGQWPSEKGFVNGNQDSTTGLVNLGAREYDPAIGRFVSIDPIMDLTDPQQMHGYTYANNNPVTFSDPTGLKFDCGGGTGTYSCTNPDGSVTTQVELTGESKKKYDKALDGIRKRNKCQASFWCRNGQKVKQAASASADWLKSPDGIGFLAGLAVGVGCSALTLGVGTIACGALAGAVGAGLTAGLKGGDVGDIMLGALGGAAFGAAGGAVGAVGGSILGKGAGAVFTGVKGLGGSIAEKGTVGASTALARNVVGTAGRNGWATTKNLVNRDPRALFTPSGFKGLLKAHKVALTSPVHFYKGIVKDAAPAAVAAGGINSFLPGNVGDGFEFRPPNLISGILTNLAG
ncbi:RHS repeat domain-containing protein [Plantactinospora soyae]|uniref:RHS repeat-associated protein n=1 Tax=Plantactinospora soyae TaxID=1544732 RepID=A0A927M3Q7_9ACTN|nr:RHS repeat-associated core domain-containing protein [Plantactinospora soyae]MBE1487623.1 RHS repeat-associated protein [Plantactinospora soyae]